MTHLFGFFAFAAGARARAATGAGAAESVSSMLSRSREDDALAVFGPERSWQTAEAEFKWVGRWEIPT